MIWCIAQLGWVFFNFWVTVRYYAVRNSARSPGHWFVWLLLIAHASILCVRQAFVFVCRFDIQSSQYESVYWSRRKPKWKGWTIHLQTALMNYNCLRNTNYRSFILCVFMPNKWRFPFLQHSKRKMAALDLMLKSLVASKDFKEQTNKNWAAISRLIPGTTVEQVTWTKCAKFPHFVQRSRQAEWENFVFTGWFCCSVSEDTKIYWKRARPKEMMFLEQPAACHLQTSPRVKTALNPDQDQIHANKKVCIFPFLACCLASKRRRKLFTKWEIIFLAELKNEAEVSRNGCKRPSLSDQRSVRFSNLCSQWIANLCQHQLRTDT